MEEPTQDDAIRVLYSLKWADWDIAAALKCSTAWVASRREELDLIPANKFPILAPGRRPNPLLTRPAIEAVIKAGPPPLTKKITKCLKCRKEFEPPHAGRFICDPCNRENSRSSSMADNEHSPHRGRGS